MDNVLLIQDGATFTVTNRSMVITGYDDNWNWPMINPDSPKNTLHVHNATFRHVFDDEQVRDWMQFNINRNGMLLISGTNTLAHSDYFVMRNDSTLRFDVHKKGFMQTPFIVKKLLSLYHPGVHNGGDPDNEIPPTLIGCAWLEVNATAWARSTGGKITLIEYKAEAHGNFDWPGGNLTELVSRVIKDSNEFEVYASPDGMSVILEAPPKNSTTIIVR